MGKLLTIEILILPLLLILFPMVNAETTFKEGKMYISGQNPISPIGGGGGGGDYTPDCNPLWICEEWSSCSGGVRSRTCVDISYCNSDERPSLLLSCSQPLPRDRIVGCVTFSDLNILIGGWKVDVYPFTILDESIRKWKNNIDC